MPSVSNKPSTQRQQVPHSLVLRALLVALAVLLLAPPLHADARANLRALAAAQLVAAREPLLLLALRQVGEQTHTWGFEDPDLDFWLVAARARAANAVTILGLPAPLLYAALRVEPYDMLLWGTKAAAELTEVPRLDPQALLSIQHDRAFPSMRHRKPDQPLTPQELEEIQLYCDAVKNAANTPAALFRAAAEEHEHLQFGQLFRFPEQHAGKVVALSGKLKRLLKEEAPAGLRREGIPFVYEAWIYLPTPGSNPVSVILPELPPKLQTAESLDVNVRFAGYFFKRYRYASGQGARNTLFFIAPTLTVEQAAPAPVENANPFQARDLIGGMLLLGGGTVVLLFGLAWWFRRGDAAVRDKLHQLQAQRFVDALEEGQLENETTAAALSETPPPDQPPTTT